MNKKKTDITITIGDEEFNEDEAKELLGKLKKLFEPSVPLPLMPYPIPYPYYPTYPIYISQPQKPWYEAIWYNGASTTNNCVCSSNECKIT
jgi:hypothetical protein